MRIHNNLLKWADFDPTKESQSVSLKTICEDVEKGKITLPIFQTYIRWKLEKCVELLDFQLSGKAPVSPISINIIQNKEFAVPQVAFITREVIDNDSIEGKHSVNDGQQRISCNYKAYSNHEDFKCVVLDISSGKFCINREELKPHQIPVGILYNKDENVLRKYLKQHKELQTFEVQTLLLQIRRKFLSYYYTINYAKDLKEEEQRGWFEVLNLAGTRVTNVEVGLTEMLVKGIDFYKDYSEKFAERLEIADMANLFRMKSTEVSIPLSALNPAYRYIKNKEDTIKLAPIASDAKSSYISKLDKQEIKKTFQLTLDALDWAIDFIESNSLKSPERMDYITYLLGVYVMCGNTQLNQAAIDYLIKWYNDIVFPRDNGDRRDLFNSVCDKVKAIF